MLVSIKTLADPTQSLTDPIRSLASPTQADGILVALGPLALSPRVGHVHFMLFVSISFALGTQRKPVFEWNMGLRHFDT